MSCDAAGTLSDKIAAMTLLVQEAPLFRLHTLDLLLGLAGKGDRRCTQMAVEAVKVNTHYQTSIQAQLEGSLNSEVSASSNSVIESKHPAACGLPVLCP